MKHITKDDIIVTTKWWELADWHFDRNNPKLQDGRVVAVDPTSIKEFFDVLLEQDGSRENYYNVITCRSDYGIFEQAKHPVAADLKKWVPFQLDVARHGYADLMCPARMNRERCDIKDRYSVKCYAHTDSTFNEIPMQVNKWFITNCGITDNKVVSIPFGVQDENTAIAELDNFDNELYTRDAGIYCNWQFYTLERFEAFTFLNEVAKWNDYITVKRNRPHQEYLEDLARHRYTFSPQGNGMDCYRNLEILYCGGIPIFESKDVIPTWIKSFTYVNIPDYRFLPLMTNSLSSFQSYRPNSKEENPNFDKLKFSYWKNLITK